MKSVISSKGQITVLVEVRRKRLGPVLGSLIFAGILTTILGATAFAGTYYVAPISTSCNPISRGSGTLADPWTNLYDALTQHNLRPGDILQLRAGTYRNAYNGFATECGNGVGSGIHTVMPLTIAGAQASPIIIENYPGETVIIDGTDADMSRVTWSPCGADVWQTTAFNVGNAKTAQIWVNPSSAAEPGTRLRWNPSGSCALLKAGEFTISDGGTTISLRLPDNGNPNSADIRMSCQNGDCAAYPVKAEAGANWITVRKNPAGGGFFVKYGYYNVFVDGKAQNLIFDGVQFIAGGGRDYGGCFRVWNGGYVTVKNGVCREAMGEGIAFYGGGPGGGGEPGIQINNNTVEHLEIFDTGRAWVDGGGFGNNLGMSIILKNCNDCVVRGNRVRNSYGSAISVTTSENPGLQSNNVIVEQNTISNFGYLDRAFGGRNTAGIHFEPQTNSGITKGIIRNNEIYGGGVTHEEWSNGIRVSAAGWTPVTGLLIVSNSMNDLNGACIDLQENPAPAMIRSNAMNNCSKQGPTCGGGARCNLYVDPSNHTHTNNSYWAAGAFDIVAYIWGGLQFTRTSVLSYEASAVQADPLYLSSTDLRLQAISLLIDAGSEADCPATDRNGDPRPIGVGCAVGAFQNVIKVSIDIKPDSFPNTLNLSSRGTVPVAILSSPTFDATTVNPATVTLASAAVRLRANGRSMAVVQDVNNDGRMDLLLHVSTSAHQLSETDTEAVLVGKTFGGRTIIGSDPIRVVP